MADSIYSFRARYDTTVVEKLALVSGATRAAPCIFGICGVLIDIFLVAQFEGFSA